MSSVSVRYGLDAAARPRGSPALTTPAPTRSIGPSENPGLDFDGDVRPGDNLYSNSVIALDPNTGKLKWHYHSRPTTHTIGLPPKT
jgi:outer membrane protein assembly factor BamB